jgi:hypothetical protein
VKSMRLRSPSTESPGPVARSTGPCQSRRSSIRVVSGHQLGRLPQTDARPRRRRCTRGKLMRLTSPATATATTTMGALAAAPAAAEPRHLGGQTGLRSHQGSSCRSTG